MPFIIDNVLLKTDIEPMTLTMFWAQQGDRRINGLDGLPERGSTEHSGSQEKGMEI